jgi:dipeptidase E
MRLLLLSNSRNPGQGYLEHVREEITDFLGPIRDLLFVPYAGVEMSHGQYADTVRRAFAEFGIEVRSVSEEPDPVAAVRRAGALAVGGGNSFQLLRLMYQHGLLAAVRVRVQAGVPYIGWSAGSNLACPTIRTTNDMPIVEPPSLAALGLVPFQINPHYTDEVIANHGGETRAERIAEFLVLNPDVPVVGLKEGSWLRIEGGEVRLGGPHSLRLFNAGQVPRDILPGQVELWPPVPRDHSQTQNSPP